MEKIVKKKRKIAIFDIDGTLFRSSLLVELVEELVREGLFPEKAKTHYAKAYRNWNNRTGSYESFIDTLVESFMKHIKGVSYGDFYEVCRVVSALHTGKVYSYTKKLIADHKKKGYYILGISQSPKAILDLFCKPYKFDKVYGRFYELGPQDKFTGEVTDLHMIGNKANILKRVLEKENITMKDSVGVGDTEGDISFLDMVDNPICFNPNKKLYNHAKRKGWEVVVERKDVVYFL